MFALAEVIIHPHEHDRDLGVRLEDGLLADQDASLGAVKLDRTDARTWAAFSARGWIEVGAGGDGGEAARLQTAPTRLRWMATPMDKRIQQNPDGLEHDARSQPPEGSAAAL